MREDFKILLAQIDEADQLIEDTKRLRQVHKTKLNEEALTYVQLHIDSGVEAVYIDPSYWGWDCEQSPFNKCIYDNIQDPCHDHCLICGDPEERK